MSEKRKKNKSNVCLFRTHAQMCACVFTKSVLVVNHYLMSSSIRFHVNPSICSGDIPLVVTLYNLEVKILFFHPEL